MKTSSHILFLSLAILFGAFSAEVAEAACEEDAVEFVSNRDIHRIKRHWKKNVRKLKSEPMQSFLKTIALDNEADEATFECYEITVSTLDSIPVTGYIAYPKSAGKKALPVRINFHEDGPEGTPARISRTVSVSKSTGAIAIEVNGTAQVEDADKSLLRAERIVDFSTYVSQSDGKTIVVSGEGEGRRKAVILSKLDNRTKYE